jgi:hypothetical protein
MNVVRRVNDAKRANVRQVICALNERDFGKDTRLEILFIYVLYHSLFFIVDSGLYEET